MYNTTIENKKKKMAFVKSIEVQENDLLNLYKVAMDMNNERNSLSRQRRENLEILDYLLSFQKGNDQVDSLL